jgi:hypothetical protein
VNADALHSFTSMTEPRSLAPPRAVAIDLSAARAHLPVAAAASGKRSSYCGYMYHADDAQDGGPRDVRAGIMRGKNTSLVHERRSREGASDVIVGDHSSASRGVHTQMGVPTQINVAMHEAVGSAEMYSQGVVGNPAHINASEALRIVALRPAAAATVLPLPRVPPMPSAPLPPAPAASASSTSSSASSSVPRPLRVTNKQNVDGVGTLKYNYDDCVRGGEDSCVFAVCSYADGLFCSCCCFAVLVCARVCTLLVC